MASNYTRDSSSARPIKLTRYATLEPDGTLRLPPIVQPKAEDPFANSKLLTYRLSRQKEAQLTKIVCVCCCYCCTVFYAVYGAFCPFSPTTFEHSGVLRTAMVRPPP